MTKKKDDAPPLGKSALPSLEEEEIILVAEEPPPRAVGVKLGEAVIYTDKNGGEHLAFVTRATLPATLRVFPAWSDDYPIEALHDDKGMPGTWRRGG